MYVFCSTDKGKTWSTNLADGSFAGPKCPEWAKVRYSGVCPEQTVPVALHLLMSVVCVPKSGVQCNEDEFLIAGITIAFDDSGSLWALYANSTGAFTQTHTHSTHTDTGIVCSEHLFMF